MYAFGNLNIAESKYLGLFTLHIVIQTFCLEAAVRIFIYDSVDKLSKKSDNKAKRKTSLQDVIINSLVVYNGNMRYIIVMLEVVCMNNQQTK